MLFGAVHFLLLGGAEHPLARYYPSCVTEALPPEDGLWSHFKNFCSTRSAAIQQILETRRTQTNEIGRSGLLVPAFAYVAALFPGSTWRLVEIGASAGLNLNWDAYGYRIGDASLPAAISTGIDLTLTTRLKAATPLLPATLSSLSESMAMRIGVEMHPVDLASPEDRRWLQALVWPDRPDRIRSLSHAIRIAESHPPPLHPGNGVAILPDLLASTPNGVLPLIFHSFVRYQFTKPEIAQFDNTLKEFGRTRPLAHLAIEWTGTADPTIELAVYRHGAVRFYLLGTCHPHGDWLAWRASGTQTLRTGYY